MWKGIGNFFKWGFILITSFFVSIGIGIVWLACRVYPLFKFISLVLFPVVYTITYWENLMNREWYSVALVTLPIVYLFIQARKVRKIPLADQLKD